MGTPVSSPPYITYQMDFYPQYITYLKCVTPPFMGKWDLANNIWGTGDFDPGPVLPTCDLYFEY